jgi:hypothetical protein
MMNLIKFILLLLVCLPTELIWNYGSCTQLVGLPGRVISPVTRLLPTQKNTSTEEGAETSMSRVELESTILIVERAKTFHALDRAATVIDVYFS